MSRRGMTLVEVLAAVVLLGLLGGVSFSLLRDARLRLETPAPSGPDATLGILADLILEDPAAFGLEDDPLQWPADIEVGATEHGLDRVSIRRIDAPDAEHTWLVFSAGDTTTFRWLAKPEEP